jgi:UDP-N-acetylmuramyl tripeptide synthase
MGLRIKYSSGIQISNSQFKIEEDLNKAINLAVDQIPKDKTLYILATYSAMLDTRKHLKGRAIL